MKRAYCQFVLLTIFVFPAVLFAESMTLYSPDSSHCVVFDVEDELLFYSVLYKEKPVIGKSRLGFLLEDGSPFISQPYLSSRDIISVDETWKPVCGERAEIPQRYNQLALTVAGDAGREMVLIFRAYDEGVAFCYEFPMPIEEGKPIVFGREATEFVLTDNHPVWATYSAQGVYEKIPVDQVKAGCQRPLLVEQGDGVRLAIGEARLVDFARMLFEPSVGVPNALAVRLGSKVVVDASPEKPFRTPWRFIMAADRTGDLLQRNYLLQNLNDPCEIEDTSWIKPGKVIREATLTTEGGKACVDFAAERGLQYVEYDAGWYGPENDETSDATTVTLDPKRSKGPLDLHEVIRYADSKGIGVLVYVNQRALAKQLDEILPLYRDWGIKGIKFGFVHVGSQEWTTWLHDAVKKCAEHRLMVDIHDEHRDTGWCRTYPNLMTVEGIRGNEEMPPPEQNVVLSMTRMLCGIADYTPCWYSDRIKTSRAHQLALPVVFYSPWTFLYWYDRPAMFKGEAELDLWKELPTVWDETKVLIDDIPNTVAVARRSGEIWYVGILNAGEKREVEIPLRELTQGYADRKTGFSATFYGDKGLEESDGRGMEIRTEQFAPGTPVTETKIPMRSNGGAVIKLERLAADPGSVP